MKNIIVKKLTNVPTIGFFVSLSMSLYLFVSSILFSSPFQRLRAGNTRFFFDDRDGWLDLASAISQGKFEPELTWQLAFWTPGNIGILSLGNVLFQSTYLAAIFHVFVVSIAQATLVYLIIKNFHLSNKYYFLTILGVVIFHLSFLFQSAFVDSVLCPDYLASILFCSAIVLLYEFINEKAFKLSNFMAIVFFASASAYIRITAYQIVIISLFICISYTIYKIITKQILTLRFKKLFSLLIVITLTFVPWIVIRSEIAYNGNYFKAAQFSYQGKFALGLQWADSKDFLKYPEFELMGLGIACKIDPVKCEYFSERKIMIENKILDVTMDDEFEYRSVEALKTFVKNPFEWVILKSKYIPSTYFQSSVYDTVDGKKHFSLDLVLIALLLPYNIFMITRLRDKYSKYFMATVQFVALSLFSQLFLTQVLLRFYLPSIMLTILTSILSTRIFVKEKLTYRSQLSSL